MRALTLLPLLALAACAGGDKVGGASDTGGTALVDADGDGWTNDEDCDDDDPARAPGLDEVCDGVDNDCDDEVDEGVGDPFYADADADGYGDPSAEILACEAPTGAVTLDQATDCDDDDDRVHPAATELCDGVDNDCDGTIDLGLTITVYSDADADGAGDPATATEQCAVSEGQVEDGTDCDDTTADVRPGNAEVCDELDNNCDGTVDEGVTTTFWADRDSDGYGDAGATLEACALPAGYADNPDDCDDGAMATSPAATELCDTIDNDCDGTTDEDDAADALTWYADSDGDGYGDAASTWAACGQPSGFVADATDCDDGAAGVNPAAAEVCDGSVDEDCDGLVDDDDPGVTATSTWYLDADSDGYGNAARSSDSCVAPSGTVADATDCDDLDVTAFPGGSEVCDGADNDCDGTTDEDDAADALTWYADSDGDGYGDSATTDLACDAPSGFVSDDTDCDDADSGAYPGATETCDGVDEDCDGDTDEDVLGDGAACAAESCDAILDARPSASDGTYTLDPTGTGLTDSYTCDMTTDGGGWTRIIRWNREDDGDTIADLEGLMTENFNNMGNWTDRTGYIRWNDGTSGAKALDYELAVDVPNASEGRFTVDYYGYSMEQSSVFFYVSTSAGTEENLMCYGLVSGSLTYYSTTERSYLPTYTCSNTASGSFTEELTDDTTVFSDEITGLHFTSLHHDNGTGDWSYLYDFEFWVR